MKFMKQEYRVLAPTITSKAKFRSSLIFAYYHAVSEYLFMVILSIWKILSFIFESKTKPNKLMLARTLMPGFD